MAKLSETVLKLLDDADAAKQKAQQADKEHAVAVKELKAAQRVENKAKEASVEAHKAAVVSSHAVVEGLTKELEAVNVEPEVEKPVEPSPVDSNTVVPASEVVQPKS